MLALFKKRIRGFSLLELMITIAIVGILTMVALPSYTTYIERSRRGDGMDLLLRVAAAQQMYHLTNRTYAAAMTDLNADVLSEDAHYIAVVTAANNRAFTIEARTSGTGVTGTQVNDGAFRFRSTGVKSWDCNNDASFSCSWDDASQGSK